MAKLLMITGRGSAVDLASGKKGAFYNTLEEFHKYWERIDIICPKVSSFKFQVSSFGNVFIHPSPWPLILQSFWILKRGREIYKEQKFDLITVHEYPPFYNGIGARILWSKIRATYILEIFHILGYPKAGSLKEKIYKLIFYLFIKYDSKKAKAVRVMNSQVRDKLIDLGVSESKIKLIPAIYIDLDIFKPMDLEKKYDLIFIGRLVKNKGIDLLLEAVSKLKIQNSNFKMIIVGSGSLEKDLKFKIENLKLRNNVIFHGWAKDSQEVARLLNQSKILIMPSYNEGGPRVVLEAMACGVPVLATSVGLVPDLGSDVIQTDWSGNDIAKKAKLVLDNHSEYMRLRQEGLEITKQFEKKSAIKNYAEKLKEIID